MTNTTRLCTSSILASVFTAYLAACGPPVSESAAAAESAAALSESDPTLNADCSRPPASANRQRKVVVSHPYSDSGDAANVFQVLELSADGKLTQTRTTFTMGLQTGGTIVFTPDGQVGLAAQDDGSIGVFRFATSGAVEVVHAAFTGVTYATGLVMDPSGKRVYVLNNEWREYGGGVYAASIGCDGTLTSLGLLAAAKLPAGLVLLPPRSGDTAPRAVVAATDILSSAASTNAHLLRWPALPSKPTLLASADGFGDDKASVASIAATPDSKYVLVGDNNLFSGIDNRIAVLAVNGSTLTPKQLLTPIEDPVSIVMSPFGNAGLVVSGFGNAIFRLSYDPTAATTPLANQGELTYVGIKPQLPAGAVLLDRGRLRGRVLVAEDEGVRQVSFNADGTITDLGLTLLGDALSTIPGGIGVQP